MHIQLVPPIAPNKTPTREGADLSLLLVWLRWYGRWVLAIGLFLLLLFALRQSPASLIIGAFLVAVVFPVVRFGTHMAARGRTIPALAVVSASIWSVVLLTGARGSTSLMAALPLLVIPMVLALPHVSSRGLFRIAMAASAVCAGAVVLTLPDSLLPTSLPEETLAIIVIPLAIVATGLALLSLWQVASRLRASVTETQAINVALAESERSLERKVEERTAELEDAVAEISAVQKIVSAASSTLDPKEVLEMVLASVRRIVPFDQAGVLLLDESGHTLIGADVVGAGVSPEMVDRIKQLSIPVDETNSAFAYVVRKNRSFLLREINDETVKAMSPSDRQFYDANPQNPPQALFFCPLEINNVAVGVFYLGRQDGAIDLQEKALTKVQGYVSHLSNAIRNARLFDETKRLNRSLAAAEDRISKLAESSADALDDVGTWASEVAKEIAVAIGVVEIAVWLCEGNSLERLCGGTTADLSIQDFETLKLTGEPVVRDGDRVFPVVGLTGEFRAALVVAGGKTSLGADGERLIRGFTRHLGSTLELRRMRRDLAEAGERRRASADEMLERGVDLLKVCRRCGRCYDQKVEVCEADQTILDPPLLFPYRVAGRYRLRYKVAEGAMGIVFRAYDERLEREVAVKVIKAEIFNQKAMRDRFEREARAVARIDHPGVVAVFDYGEIEDGSLYIVMEWLRGIDLARVLQLHGAGRPRDVAVLLRQAAAGLAAAHARQLVHRDIKPANIFLTPAPDGFRVKILDFGVAKEMSRDAKVTQTGMIVGTPRFMSPEQLLSKPIDARSDIYSLAAVVFQALTGERLVRAEDFAQVLVEVVNQEPPKVSAILAQAPREIDRLFARALAKDAEQRPANVEEWAVELAEVIDKLRIGRDAWRIEAEPEVEGGANDEETVLSR